MKNIETNRKKVCTEQPFLISQTQRYDEIKPDLPFVSMFYQFQIGHDNSHVIALPDGCIDMVFTCDEDNPNMVVYGSLSKSKFMPTEPDTTYFGIRFCPAIVPKLLDANVIDIADKIVPITPLISLGEAKTLEAVIEDQPFENRVNHIITTLEDKLVPQKAAMNPLLFENLVKIIINSSTDIRINELESETGYSARYICKVFQSNTGISPKDFCRLFRFQKVINYIHTIHKSNEFATLATQFGYYDQSHFIREFKYFTGFSPGQYAKEILPSYYAKNIR